MRFIPRGSEYIFRLTLMIISITWLALHIFLKIDSATKLFISLLALVELLRIAFEWEKNFTVITVNKTGIVLSCLFTQSKTLAWSVITEFGIVVDNYSFLRLEKMMCFSTESFCEQERISCDNSLKCFDNPIYAKSTVRLTLNSKSIRALEQYAPEDIKEKLKKEMQ